MKKRNLGSMALLFLAPALFAASPAAQADPAIANAAAPIETAINASLTQAGASLHIQLLVGNASAGWGSDVKFRNIAATDFGDLKTYGPILVSEWQKYSASWLVSSGIQRIALVEGLSVNGQNRCAAPDSDTLYLDVGAECGTSNEDYVRRVLHHEFYHIIESNHFGSYYYQDPSWAALNPSNWHYDGGDGSLAYSWSPNHCPSDLHPYPGFVTCYATSALQEDKPETYSFIMATGGPVYLNQWTPTDPVLASKVNYLKAFILSISPEMRSVINPRSSR